MVVRGVGTERRSELTLKVVMHGEGLALEVKVDGIKLTAEICVTCPRGLVSCLCGAEKRRFFVCECGESRCAQAGGLHVFNVERRSDELIWSRTNYPAASSSVSFDHHQACLAVCQALEELKSAVDARPEGIASCAGMSPGKLTYEELVSCIEQSKHLADHRS